MKYYDFIEKNAKLPPLIIIEGTERQFSDLAIAAIEKRVRQDDPAIEVERYRAPALDSYRPIAESLVSLGFFSARRCLIIRDIHELRAAPRRALWDIVQNVAEPCMVILEELVSPLKKQNLSRWGFWLPKARSVSIRRLRRQCGRVLSKKRRARLAVALRLRRCGF